MSQLLNTKIKRFLFDKRRCYVAQAADAEVAHDERLTYYKNQLIIPRARAVYKTFSISAIQKKDLRAYVASQVVALSPFASSGFYVCYHNNTAMLWIWDSDHELGLLEKFSLSYAETVVLPETVLYSFATSNSSTILVNCKLGGYEGQIWRDGILVGSRYWPQKPSSSQLNSFLRANNIASDITIDEPSVDDFNVFPWFEKQWTFLFKREFLDGVVPVILASCLFAFLGWQLAQYTTLSMLNSIRESQLTEQQRAVEATLNSRQQALQLNQQNNTLSSKVSQPQMLLLYEVATKLTDEITEIRAWRYQTNELRLEVTVSKSEVLDVATLVGNLEQLSYIQSVSARRLGTLGNRWEIAAEVNW